MRNILIFALAFIFTSCNSYNYVVHKVTESEKIVDKQGFFYNLPRTVITLEVELEKTDKIKGPYAAFAGKFLGSTNAILDNSTSYSIVGLKMRNYNEPDPDKYFFIEIPKKLKKDFVLNLNENGSLISMNCKKSDEKDKQSINDNQLEELGTSGSLPDPFLMFINTNILEKVDTVFETIHLDTAKIQKQVVKRSVIEKSLEQKANETANYILKLNEQKMELVTGYQEIAYTANTLEFMVKTIDKLINEYMSLFNGKTVTDRLSYKFTFTPSLNNKKEKIFAFTYDKKNGIGKSPAQEKINNYYIEFIPSNTTEKIQKVIDIQNKNTERENGLFYNIPELTTIRIVNSRNEIIYETQMLINQFGTTYSLPNKKIRILLNQPEYSIKTIELF